MIGPRSLPSSHAAASPPPGGKAGTLPQLLALSLLTLLPLAGCASRGDQQTSSPCLDGSSRCAYAQVPEGMRGVLHGHRIQRLHWRQKTNRESGVPDVGIVAEWQPTTRRR